MASRRFLLALLLSLLLAAALAARARTAQKTAGDQQKPTFRAGVSFVRVDVYPTVDGRAVPDLARDDFEVLEDGVAQRIETFERVVAGSPGAEAVPSEPRSVEESKEAAADPRNRLFVVFFDTLHTFGYKGAGTTNMGGATYDPTTVGRALAAFLEQLIGANDLVGIMTPEQSVHDLSFTRRPSSLEDFLRSGARFQERFLDRDLDDTERKYQFCYGDTEESLTGTSLVSMTARMIARRREMLMLGALRDLVLYLQTLREGRTAVIVVSEGWTLFTPDQSLARIERNQVPGQPPIGVDRGKPVLGDPRTGTTMWSDCERDRMLLARLDDERDFRRMLDEANRANVSFYPVDIRGLTPESSMARRSDSLRTLATATDGFAVVDSNDFAPGLKRIADDLSSYYLLGYYSTNAKADGTFRRITVRVKRPGVAVRARRGYRAPTEEEVRAASAANAPRDPELEMRELALGALGAIRADRPLHLAAGFSWTPPPDVRPDPSPAAPRAVLWVAAELDVVLGRRQPWSEGAAASITVTSAAGQEVATAEAELRGAAPRFLLRLSHRPVAAGEFLVRVVARPGGGGPDVTTETVRVRVPEGQAEAVDATPLLYRRGPFTGPAFLPTADLRFRRAERLRAELPLGPLCESATARLLDRTGQPLAVPVTAALAGEAGERVATADLTLAPLAPADYLLEVGAVCGGAAARRLVAFRIVP